MKANRKRTTRLGGYALVIRQLQIKTFAGLKAIAAPPQFCTWTPRAPYYAQIANQKMLQGNAVARAEQCR
jgi:hypothetical protein